MTEHLDDDAELYALGLVEPERAAEVEAHLTSCAACCARVAAAESAGAALAASLPPMPAATPKPRAWWPQIAAAAAVVFAATTALEANLVHVAADRSHRTDIALSALASSHFGHTTLTSNSPIVAKAIYARDGSWAYIVVNGAPPNAHVIIRENGISRDLGTLGPGAPSTLFVQQPGRADEFDIASGTTTVAHGKPMY